MRKEQEPYNNPLHHELKHLHFTNHEEVLKRTHPKTKKEKFAIWWNKEIEIPLRFVSAVMVCFLLIGSYSIYEAVQEDGKPMEEEKRVLVEEGGNKYWKDDFERAVSRYEG